MKILRDKEARDFWHNAMDELHQRTPRKQQKSLNIECLGYWKEGAYYIAFDNYGNELYTEEFITLAKTLRYIHNRMLQ